MTNGYDPKTPASVDTHSTEDLKAAIAGQMALFDVCEIGELDQHLSPAIQIAIDCMWAELKRRENEPA